MASFSSSSSSSSLWRQSRWLLMGAGVVVLWACNDHALAIPEPKPQVATELTFQEAVNRDIDILFMVDDSLSMAPLIDKLAVNFPAFIQVLQNLPGGLPNIHLAVVSSDLGAGQWTGIAQCRVGGDGGEFQDQVGAGTAAAGVPCAATGLDPGQHFISNVNGVANYDTNMGLATVFSCIANLGEGGCGFEHQIQSVVRALGADPAFPLPAKNAGFLRSNAYLAIILVTNEDDDSAPPVTPLFDTTSESVADPYGPLQSYRANEFGHLCDGAPPPRTHAASFPPGACVSAEDKGLLIPLHTMIAELETLKTDPSTIFVAAIAGPPDPYNVILVPAPEGTSDAGAGIMWPNIDHSCVQSSGEYGDPSVRIKQFVDAFGSNGVFESICAASFSPALADIATALSRILSPQCVSGQLLDVNGDRAADDPNGVAQGPDCAVTQHFVDASGTASDTVIPSCQESSGGQCWNLVTDPARCPASGGVPAHMLTLTPPPSPNGAGLKLGVSCSIQPG